MIALVRAQALLAQPLELMIALVRAQALLARPLLS